MGGNCLSEGGGGRSFSLKADHRGWPLCCTFEGRGYVIIIKVCYIWPIITTFPNLGIKLIWNA